MNDATIDEWFSGLGPVEPPRPRIRKGTPEQITARIAKREEFEKTRLEKIEAMLLWWHNSGGIYMKRGRSKYWPNVCQRKGNR